MCKTNTIVCGLSGNRHFERAKHREKTHQDETNPLSTQITLVQSFEMTQNTAVNTLLINPQIDLFRH